MARDRTRDIAVTGISARFPGANDLDTWWAALTSGKVMTTRYDRDTLLAAGIPAGLADDPGYVPVRGHLADADRFDNTLFRIPARDARLMDPQHRLMLEAAWAALEDAAAGRTGEGPRTGVYASGGESGYLRAVAAAGALDPATQAQVAQHAEPDHMAGRIAYKLGLRGPALAVCSSSLATVHVAAQALLSGDCDQAVVVAAGLTHPQGGHLHRPGGTQSAAGACRPFDARADGMVAGSGVACVILRRLADALEDGPPPYGVILGSAVNNDGAAKPGYHAPSAAAQEDVIRSALRTARVSASSLGYLEAHATGTRLGDPIEWSAASAALKALGARPGQVAVGALKGNIGHLHAAAGLAALIKALLVVRYGTVPPVAGFTRLNPLLDTGGSPLWVPRSAMPWSGPEPRRAGISAFGVGGTNAHAIVEQPPSAIGRPRPTPSTRPRSASPDHVPTTPDHLPTSPAAAPDHVPTTASDPWPTSLVAAPDHVPVTASDRVPTSIHAGTADLSGLAPTARHSAATSWPAFVSLASLHVTASADLAPRTTPARSVSPDPIHAPSHDPRTTPPAAPGLHASGPETHLILLSAADPDALERAAARLARHLATQAPDLADVSFTLAVGRAELPERLAVTGRTAAEVALALSADGASPGRRVTDGPAPVVFLFPGQGTQYPGMAVPLAESLPGFPSALAACLDAFDPVLAARMERALLDPAFPAGDLCQTELTQPALFALEHAAATALLALGVRPASLLGHGLGEIIAACLAGVLRLPDAARFITVRGNAMQGCPPGVLLALDCPEARGLKLAAEAGADLELAAVDSPGTCVLGGSEAAVKRFEEILGQSVPHRRLRTSHAFHTRLIQPAVPELALELTDIRLQRPTIPYAANSTGRVIPAGVVVSPETFIDHLRQPARYAEAMASTALALPGAVTVEVGPGATLSSLAEAARMTSVPLSPARTRRPADEVLSALGALWTLGLPLDPRALCSAGRRVHLPAYPFNGPRWSAPHPARVAALD
ncbi:beta-ketoacyl synthase N-terminal-like domain-containing protein [Nonomuraea typhae]|uniref:beta-ketoacyl synthase N-terminal-like domain-containing protein n=1 Tax=Nonomuraea typhae TaxID=2603600 RepID=UPI0012F7AF6A|nr:type I polyketide synthase [Nonomuraea typhae]